MQLELYVFTLAQEQLEWGGSEKETIPILIQDEIFLDYFFMFFIKNVSTSFLWRTSVLQPKQVK